MTKILDTEEEGIKAALIRMGWTPPVTCKSSYCECGDEARVRCNHRLSEAYVRSSQRVRQEQVELEQAVQSLLETFIHTGAYFRPLERMSTPVERVRLVEGWFRGRTLKGMR